MLAGRAAPGGGAYRPFTEALMPPVRAGLVRESEDLRPFRSSLGRILPGWASAWPAEPGVDPVLLLGEGVLRLLLTIDAPVRVLVLDDLQDADPDTLALLKYLAPAVDQLPILIVATQSHPPPVPQIDRLPATRIRLTRLSPEDTAALVDRFGPIRCRYGTGSWSGPRVCRWWPLSWPPTRSRHRRAAVPASFAALVGDRLARLDAGARRLLCAAAVLGAPSTWTPGAVARRARCGGGGSGLLPSDRARPAGSGGRRAALAAWSGPGDRRQPLLPIERQRAEPARRRAAARPRYRRRRCSRGRATGLRREG